MEVEAAKESSSFKVGFNCVEDLVAELISRLSLLEVTQSSLHHPVYFPPLPPV
jgi:hypothetical protein